MFRRLPEILYLFLKKKKTSRKAVPVRLAPPQLRCFVMLMGDRWFEGGVKKAISSMFTWNLLVETKGRSWEDITFLPQQRCPEDSRPTQRAPFQTSTSPQGSGTPQTSEAGEKVRVSSTGVIRTATHMVSLRDCLKSQPSFRFLRARGRAAKTVYSFHHLARKEQYISNFTGWTTIIV